MSLLTGLVFRHACRHQLRGPLLRSYCVQPQEKVRKPGYFNRYVVDHYIRFVAWYEQILEKKYPKVFELYKTFTVGTKVFLVDAQKYTSVSSSLWAGKPVLSFTSKELILYKQMPKDIVKVTPILLFSLLPFALTVVFPIIYMFPRQLLCKQFWTPREQQEFSRYYLKHRVKQFNSVLDYLHLHAREIQDEHMKEKMRDVLRKLHSSLHPTPQEVLELQPLFRTKPYVIDNLTLAHSRHLGKMLDLSFRRWRLTDDGMLLHHIDTVMVREGIESMSDTDLEEACFSRGLNPVGLKRNERISYLKRWTEVSKHITADSVSLLLHAPVFLAYNYATNKELMEHYKFRWRWRKSK